MYKTPAIVALILALSSVAHAQSVPCPDGTVPALTGQGQEITCVKTGGAGNAFACAAGQYMVLIAGKPLCRDLPQCKGHEALLWDGETYVCVKRGDKAEQVILAALEKRIVMLESALAALVRAGGRKLFAGFTSVKTNGRVERAKVATGIPAANALCSDEFGPGSSMCTEEEIYQSATAGRFSLSEAVGPGWIWFPSKVGSREAASPNEGLSDTCASYTYPTGDKAWTGVGVTTRLVPETRAWGLHFLHGEAAPCFAQMPIACCR